MSEPTSPPVHSAWWAIVRQRCPRCREGLVWAGPFVMNDRCPACDLLFMREPGYFTGAMYITYGLGIPIIALFTLLAYLIFPTWKLYQLVLLAWVGMLPMAPMLYRYSRVLWLHFDSYFDPD